MLERWKAKRRGKPSPPPATPHTGIPKDTTTTITSIGKGSGPAGAGGVGGLPRPVWVEVLRWVPVETALHLRRTHPFFRALVPEAGCRSAAPLGRAGLASVDTTGLGRMLVVRARLGVEAEPVQLDIVASLATAVRRGHLVTFSAQRGCTPRVKQAAEAELVEASEKSLLQRAHLPGDWDAGTVGKLRAVVLKEPVERDFVAAIVAAGTLESLFLSLATWTDATILRSLRHVYLAMCFGVADLSPLADVPELTIDNLDIKAIPAMRNSVLEVFNCFLLDDLSGLQDGHVGHLRLCNVERVRDVSAVGAMRPRPRTVVLELCRVRDVSMLAGVHRLELIQCELLDREFTRELESRVGIFKWFCECP